MYKRQDFTQSIEYITKISHKHVNNNHKKLKYNQVKDLTEINSDLEKLLSSTKQAYDNRSFEEIGQILDKKQGLYDRVSEKIAVQIARTREEDSSPKNTTLYFSILLETKDLITATINLLQEYYDKAALYNDPAIVPVESAELEE